MKQPIRCVMLVDDYPATNYLHQMLLRETGVVDDVMVCESGEEALRQINRSGAKLPDLVFLDLSLPGINGWTVLEYLEEMHASGLRVPQVGLLSTAVRPEHRRKAATYPLVIGIWEKPLTEELLQRLLPRQLIV